MNHRLRTLLIIGVGGLLSSVPAAEASSGLTIERVDTSQFPKVSVTVRSSNPDLIGSLAVTENGHPASQVQLPDPQAPVAVALAIDVSNSMGGKPLADSVRAAKSFVLSRRSTDPLGVYGFDDRAFNVAVIGNDPTQAFSGLDQLTTGGPDGTAIWAAVKLASGDLRAVPAKRRALVLLTDGQSFRDSATLEQAIAAAKAAHVSVYPIAIVTPLLRLDDLNRLARETGGSVVTARSTNSLSKVYASISARLSETATLTYYSSAPAGTPIRLKVSAPGVGSAVATAAAPAGKPVAKPGGLKLPSSMIGRIAVVGGGLLVLLCLCLVATRISTMIGYRD